MLVIQACSQGRKQGSQRILPGSSSLYPSYHPSLLNSPHSVLFLWWFPSLPPFFSRLISCRNSWISSLFPPSLLLPLWLFSPFLWDVLNFRFQDLWKNFRFWYLHLKNFLKVGSTLGVELNVGLKLTILEIKSRMLNQQLSHPGLPYILKF